MPSDSLRASRPERAAQADVVLLIVVASLARLALAATIGLGVDESYAFAVSRPLSLSYFDHPPLVFWLVSAARALGSSPVVLRLPFIALFAGTTWYVAQLTATLFGARAGLYAAIVLNLIPVFTISSGGWMLPDGPLLFGESLAAYAVARATFEPERAPRAAWVWIGVGVGISLLSKYHALLFVAGLLLWCVTSPRGRFWLRSPRTLGAIVIATMLALPVVVWNAQHDWASIRFQLARSVGHQSAISALAQNVAGQAGYILPWIWVPMLWQLAVAMHRGPRDDRRWFLCCLAIVPIVLFTLMSLRGNPGLPHWPAPGYVFVVPLVAYAIVRLEERVGVAGVRRRIIYATASLVVPVLLVVSQVSTGWMQSVTPSLFRRGDPSLDLVDWGSLRPQLVDAGLLPPGRIVAGTSWIDCAKLGYALQPVPVRCLTDDPRHFQFLPIVPDSRGVLVIQRANPSGSGRRLFGVTRNGRRAIQFTAYLLRHAVDR